MTGTAMLVGHLGANFESRMPSLPVGNRCADCLWKTHNGIKEAQGSQSQVDFRFGTPQIQHLTGQYYVRVMIERSTMKD